MLVDEKIEITLCGRNWKHYANLGYEFSKEDWQNKKKIWVNQCDVPHGVQKGTKLHVICDYCGEDYYEYPYKYYLKKDIYPSDSCGKKECKASRSKDIQLDKYGTTSMKERSKILGFALGRKTKYTKEDILQIASDKNYTVVSGLKEHVTERDVIKCVCNIHDNDFDVRIEYLIDPSRKNCPICKSEYMSEKMRDASIEEVKEIMKRKNYTLLYPDFLHNCDETIEYICNVHPQYGIQTTSLFNLRKNNCNCRLCCLPKGENHYKWKGGISSERDKAMSSFEYRQWVRSVFSRDNYICQCCGKRGGTLNAHHIFSYSSNESIRTCVENGITLCEKCHKNCFPNSFHKLYGVYNNTLDQLQEYFDIRRKELGLPPVDICKDILHKETIKQKSIS